MFAKLKKKVLEEEEAAGTPERLSFTPRKLPGGAVAVRSPPAVGDRPPLPGESEEEKKPERDAEKEKKEEEKPHPLQNVNLHPTVVPSHLKSSLTQEDVHRHLLTRIDQLQRELEAVNERLEEETKRHEEERGKWREETAAKLSDKDREMQVLQSRFDKADEQVSELKLQVVEIQLEKVTCEQNLQEDLSHLQERLSQTEREKEEEEQVWEQKREELEGRVTELDETVSDKEFQVASLQDQVKSLETFKAETLSNIVKESKDEALLKLQNEIIDLERRLHSRTMDVEMARIDADTQMRWKEEQLQEGVSRQLKLMATEKELKETVNEKDEELRELRQLLDRERAEGGKKEREVERLTAELGEASKSSTELEKKLEESEATHTRNLQEMTAQKDTRISELSKALEELQSEILGSETVEAPERNPLDFATVSTQTDPPPPPDEEEPMNEDPAVLKVSSCPDASLTNGLGGSELEEKGEGEGELTMKSHGLIEELQLLRQEQVRLQEEVAEKNKLIRFQQLKIVDMRKALNRELRSQSSVDQVTPPLHLPHSFPTPPTVPFTMTRGSGGKSPAPPPGGQIISYEDINVQYLKHVIIKFLCSREDEAMQLIRAVATLLNFTSQEEQFVKDYFDYKMSWFGSMPQPIYHPVRNISQSS